MRAGHRAVPFNATRLARLETIAWTAYYRHEWPRVLAVSNGLVREAFNLTFVGTVLGAWCVFRANVVWAPYPDNDPDRARQYMRCVYAMSQRRSKVGFDPVEAARLEVECVHRAGQHGEVIEILDGIPGAWDRIALGLAEALIHTHRLQPDTRTRIARVLRPLARFPEMGAALEPGAPTRDLRFVLGPWRWMLIVHPRIGPVDTRALRDGGFRC